MNFVLVFRRYAPFAKFGFGFEGDQRTGPSISLLATARTIGIVHSIKEALAWLARPAAEHTTLVVETGFVSWPAGRNPTFHRRFQTKS
jgi:hypothetical protein